MKVAVITGASSGLGEQYALEIDKIRNDIDEIWLIARRESRMAEIAKKLNKKSKIIVADITLDEDIKKYKDLLAETKVEIKLLINNAGFGKLGEFKDISADNNCDMVKLNCEALTRITSLTLPFMCKDSEIINVCSIASFTPNARMAVYSSTKAYVMSFSRALREELKKEHINCLSVCPGPMETEFLSVAGIVKGMSNTFDYLPRVKANVVAKKSLIASKRRKAVYTNRIFYKFYRILSKIIPHSIVMKMAKT